MKEIYNVYDFVHWVTIKVMDDKRETVEFLSWGEMRFDLRMKWDWYFRYRAALLQVKYPRYEVVFLWGNKKAEGKYLEESFKRKITSKKMAVTKARNDLKGYEDEYEKWKKEYSLLFPMEDTAEYKYFVNNLKKLFLRLDKLERELNEMEVYFLDKNNFK